MRLTSKKHAAKLLIDNTIRFMAIAEDMYSNGELSNGEQKKDYVMKELRKALKWDDSVIDEIILLVIDTLIEVDNGKLKFNHKVKKSLFCCFN
jgi:hypothetical protein